MTHNSISFPLEKRGTHLLLWLDGKCHTSQEKLHREEDLGKLWETNEIGGSVSVLL